MYITNTKNWPKPAERQRPIKMDFTRGTLQMAHPEDYYVYQGDRCYMCEWGDPICQIMDDIYEGRMDAVLTHLAAGDFKYDMQARYSGCLKSSDQFYDGGSTPLIVACSGGQPEMIEFLLKSPLTDINVRAKDNYAKGDAFHEAWQYHEYAPYATKKRMMRLLATVPDQLLKNLDDIDIYQATTLGFSLSWGEPTVALEVMRSGARRCIPYMNAPCQTTDLHRRRAASLRPRALVLMLLYELMGRGISGNHKRWLSMDMIRDIFTALVDDAKWPALRSHEEIIEAQHAAALEMAAALVVAD